MVAEYTNDNSGNTSTCINTTDTKCDDSLCKALWAALASGGHLNQWPNLLILLAQIFASKFLISAFKSNTQNFG